MQSVDFPRQLGLQFQVVVLFHGLGELSLVVVHRLEGEREGGRRGEGRRAGGSEGGSADPLSGG